MKRRCLTDALSQPEAVDVDEVLSRPTREVLRNAGGDNAGWRSGFGMMGGKLGTLFARSGHDVIFSYARSEAKLKKLAREANGSARAVTPAEAARDADALLLAVHWSRIAD